MNLLQIQDQLKSLPSDARTMQALMAYANGANPSVPPYLALGELNRRKQLMERAKMEQASQPPQGTVKDQVEQQAGVMALQQGRQQQVMQNLMRSGVAGAAGMGAPAGIPQPEAQPQVEAAGGGLMALLADKAKAKRMNSGGIVALAGGGNGDDEEEDDEDDAPTQVASSGITPAQALAEYAASRKLAERFVKDVKSPAESLETPMQFRERMIKEQPEKYGHLAKDQDQDVLARLDEMQAARRAELDKQRAENAAQKPGILQLLGRAAMDSRGQVGRSALASILGGYEQGSSSEEAKAIAREQALRAKDLEMQQVKMETINKLQELKRARDEGDLAREQKAKIDLAKLAKDHNTTVGNLIGKVVTSSGALAGRIGSADIAGKARVAAKNTSAARTNTQAQGVAIYEAQVREEHPDWSPAKVSAAALDLYLRNKQQAQLTGVVQRTTADATTALSKFKLLNPKQWKKFVADNGGDETTAGAKYISDYKADVLPPHLMPQTPGAAAPAAASEAIPLPANPKPADLKVGTIYQTRMGLGRWNGKAFEAVQ